MAPRILLVDDEATLRCIAARALRLEDYEVVEACDGIEAYELAREHHFDLVITDSRMPRLSGPDLVHRLRELHPTLPILRISGSHDSGSAEMSTGLRILFKPFDIDGLIQTVNSMMAGRGIARYPSGPGTPDTRSRLPPKPNPEEATP